MHQPRLALQQQHDQATRIAERQRPHQSRIRQREQQDVQSQSGRQGHEGHEGHQRLALQQPNRKSEIGRETIQHTGSVGCVGNDQPVGHAEHDDRRLGTRERQVCSPEPPTRLRADCEPRGG